MRIEIFFQRKVIIVTYWWKNVLKVLTGEAPKGYKNKNRDRTINNYG